MLTWMKGLSQEEAPYMSGDSKPVVLIVHSVDRTYATGLVTFCTLSTLSANDSELSLVGHQNSLEH